MGRVREESQRREEKKKQKVSEDADARKGRKVAKHCVFPMICGSEGRKVGSLKRRVRSSWPDERWTIARCCGVKHMSKSKCTKHTIVGPFLEVEMSKKCTLWWHEAQVQVKMYKRHHSRTTFGSCDVEKVHVVVARSTWKLRCRKSARRCGTKLEVKMYKTYHCRTTFGSCDVEKVHAVAARSTCPSQNVQNTPFLDHSWKLRCRKSARGCGTKHMSKSK